MNTEAMKVQNNTIQVKADDTPKKPGHLAAVLQSPPCNLTLIREKIKKRLPHKPPLKCLTSLRSLVLSVNIYVELC